MRWLASLLLLAATTAVAEPTRLPSRGTGELPNPLAVIYFATDSTRLGNQDIPVLQRAADWLAERPERVLIVRGHADTRGDAAYNMRLSQNRSDVVFDELVRLGVDPRRIIRGAYGEMEATNNLAASRNVTVEGSIWPFDAG